MTFRITPKITIIVPVLNEAATIDKCIASLFDQSFVGIIQIIVVDGGSTDSTVDIIKGFTSVSLVKTKGRTLGQDRQMGLEIADGDFVLFLDGDEIASPQWIQGHLDVLQTAEASIGPILPAESRTAVGRLFGLLSSLDHKHAQERLEAGRVVLFGSGNLAVRRAEALEVGFDSAMITAEDGDFSYRFLKRGFKVDYAADSSVYHRAPETWRGLFLYNLKLSVGNKLLLKKHRSTGILKILIGSALYPISPRFYRRTKNQDARLLPLALAYGVLVLCSSVLAMFLPTRPSWLARISRRGKPQSV